MDPLPGIGLVKTFSTGAQGSMRSAGALWDSVGDVGQMIAAVGDKGVALLNRHKELEVQREAATMELEFDQMAQEYEMEILKNPNITPEQAAEGWGKRSQQFTAKYQRDGMSPLQQDVIANRSKDLVAKGGFSALKAATIASIQNTKQAAINLINRGEETGNTELIERGFSMMGQVMPEADLEAEKMNSQRRVMVGTVERDIAADPVGMREKLEDPNFVKNHPGVAVDDVPRLKDQARAASRQSIGDSVDSFSDDVATGKVKTADDVRRLYGNRVPPRIVEQMEGELAKRFDADEAAMRKSPEYQARVVGQASAIMEGIATAEDFEERYASASFLLDSLEDSPIKRMLKERLTTTKTGKEAEIKTHADAAMKALEAYNKRELEKAGVSGTVGGTMKIPGAQEIPTSRAIADGFLRDWNKLKALGFSDEQASKIRDAKGSDKELSDSAARSIFKEEWKRRPDASFEADPLTMATADSILGGKETVSFISPEAQDAAIATRMRVEREAGERQIKLAEWLKLNPEAKAAEIDDKILEIGGEQTHRELKSGIFERKSGGGTKAGPFIPGETSLNLPKNLAPYRADFVETGLTYNIDPRFLAAVSMHETASGKSSAFINKKNAMGVSNSSGPIAFDDVGSSIKRMARLLGSTTSGPYKNARTIGEIAKIYAPVGAENDPGSINKHWVAGVSKYYKQLGGNPLSPLK